MSRPRCFTLTALRDLPEVGLTAGDVVVVDRRHPIVPVTVGNRPVADPDRIDALGTLVFLSRPTIIANHAANGTAHPPAAFSVTPSYIGAQRTLEHIEYELRGYVSSAKERAAEQRALREAVRYSLAEPLEAAPREPHASALLGTEGWGRLAVWLDGIREQFPE